MIRANLHPIGWVQVLDGNDGLLTMARRTFLEREWLAGDLDVVSILLLGLSLWYWTHQYDVLAFIHLGHLIMPAIRVLAECRPGGEPLQPSSTAVKTEM